MDASVGWVAWESPCDRNRKQTPGTPRAAREAGANTFPCTSEQRKPNAMILSAGRTCWPDVRRPRKRSLPGPRDASRWLP